jgi:Protein of unknown function (DUF2897)
MLKTILIFVLAIAVIGGGLLTLRSSRKTGMPSDDVLKRATQRAKDQVQKDDAEDNR